MGSAFGRRVRVVGSLALGSLALVLGSTTGALTVADGTAGAAATSYTLYVSATGAQTSGCFTSVTACQTIQEGVNAAEGLVAAAVTITVAGGTYGGGIVVTAQSLASLTIRGAGPTSTTIDGGGATRDVQVDGGTVTIEGIGIDTGKEMVAATGTGGGGVRVTGPAATTLVTLTDDDFLHDTAEPTGPCTSICVVSLVYGGAVDVTGHDTAIISNDSFVTDSANHGGAVAHTSTGTIGKLTMTNDLFSNDHAKGDGGAVLVAGNTFLTTDTFSNDSATKGGAFDLDTGSTQATIANSTFFANSSTFGGAIAAGGTLTLTNDTLSTDSAYVGGAVFEGTGDTTITGSRLEHDKAHVGTPNASVTGAAAGGAVASEGGVSLLVGDSFFADSAVDIPSAGGTRSAKGGAISVLGTATVRGDTFSGDSATTTGGAVYKRGPGTLTDDTFIGDTAASGGAVAKAATPLASSVGADSLAFDTFSHDTATSAGGGLFVTGGTAATLSASVLVTASCAGTVAGTVAGTDDVTTTGSCPPGAAPVTAAQAALATTLAANTSTGPETLALGPTSAAIDEVPASFCTSTPTFAKDERGKARPGITGQTSCDAGAFELQHTPVTLTQAAPTSGSTPQGTAATFQLAVAVAVAGATGTVTYTAPTPPQGVSVSPSGLVSVASTTAAGTYVLVGTETDSLDDAGTWSFTLTVEEGPAVVSANAATFTVDTPGSFTVKTTGVPAPAVTEQGTLPTGVTFTTRTDVLSGTPAAGTGGIYPVTFTATNAVGTTVQHFTLTVEEGPAVVSADATTFIVHTPGSFTVKTTGVPAPAVTEHGTLPTGVTFTTRTDVLSGTPAAGTTGIYPVTFTATNAVGTTVQHFSLTVDQYPAVVSADAAAFAVGTPATFTVKTTGVPAPAVTEQGTLPTGVAFTTGTDVLSGTPSAGSAGTYPVTFTATNTAGKTVQHFTLTVDAAGGGTPTPTSTPTPPRAPAGTSTTASGRFTTPSGRGTVADPAIGLEATVVGAGALTVGGYEGDPTPVTLSTATGRYLDVEVAPGSTFASLGITVCPGTAGEGLEWWNGAAWQRFGTEHVGATGCITATVTATTRPSLAQLTGTPVAVVRTANRIEGQTADATAAAELERAFPPTGTSCAGGNGHGVVLARDGGYADAMTSQDLAQHLDTGTLLTPTATLSAATLAALRVEGVQKVYVVGGPLAVSTAVVSELEKTPAYACGGTSPLTKATGSSIDLSVTRIAGATAYATAEAVATFVGSAPSVTFAGAYATTNATGGTGRFNETAGTGSAAPAGAQPTAILATATSWMDAESASALSYTAGIPILLTTPTSLPATTTAALQALGVKQVIVMGGPLAVTDAVVKTLESTLGISVLRVAGRDGTGTAVQLATFELSAAGTGLGWRPAGTSVLVARGDGYTDGLAGAVLEHAGATSQTPLLLTESPTELGPYLRAFLEAAGRTGGGVGTAHSKVRAVTVLGGPLAVSTALVTGMEGALGD